VAGWTLKVSAALDSAVILPRGFGKLDPAICARRAILDRADVSQYSLMRLFVRRGFDRLSHFQSGRRHFVTLREGGSLTHSPVYTATSLEKLCVDKVEHLALCTLCLADEFHGMRAPSTGGYKQEMTRFHVFGARISVSRADLFVFQQPGSDPAIRKSILPFCTCILDRESVLARSRSLAFAAISIPTQNAYSC